MMTSQSIDRRKKYTRMVLKESLLDILQEKQLFSVTVKEICELADINRSTFYDHYADQFALLTEIEDELIEDMTNYLHAYNLDQKVEALQMTEKLITYFASKKRVCLTLLSHNSHSSFEQKVRHVAELFIMQNVTKNNQTDKATYQYMSAYMISGSIEVMKRWLQNNMDKTPKEMAHLITNLSTL